MKRWVRLATMVVVLAGGALMGSAGQIQAMGGDGDGGHAVFVQTNNPAGNAIDAFQRGPDGRLTFANAYPTGGAGARTAGSASDALASQGSLVFDPENSSLLAVNAGSDTVSVFGVEGDTLRLRQVISSGGPFPVSIATRDDLVFVLDAGLAGAVMGYRFDGARLDPIAGAARSLGLPNTNPPFFLSSPAQIGFTADGRHLVVTTKTNNLIDVFAVQEDGRLSAEPTMNRSAGVPFAFLSNETDRLALVSAGTSSLSTLAVNEDGTLTPVGGPVSDGQTAACWIVSAGGFEYVANTGSGTISQFQIGEGGAVTLVNAVAAAGISGPIDMTTAAGGRLLYDQSGLSATVVAFAVNRDGSLTAIQSVAVPGGASQEGIVAT